VSGNDRGCLDAGRQKRPFETCGAIGAIPYARSHAHCEAMGE
jgi:hypothetical protein